MASVEVVPPQPESKPEDAVKTAPEAVMESQAPPQMPARPMRRPVLSVHWHHLKMLKVLPPSEAPTAIGIANLVLPPMRLPGAPVPPADAAAKEAQAESTQAESGTQQSINADSKAEEPTAGELEAKDPKAEEVADPAAKRTESNVSAKRTESNVSRIESVTEDDVPLVETTEAPEEVPGGGNAVPAAKPTVYPPGVIPPRLVQVAVKYLKPEIWKLIDTERKQLAESGKEPPAELSVAQQILEDFKKEQNALLAIPPHRNLVTLVGIGIGVPFVVTEVFESDLASQLNTKYMRGPMQLIDALKITIDLARGLNWLHRFGWIHRDLKPSNLGICRAGPGEQTGMLKIMDLGLARRVPVPTEEGAPPRKRTDKYLMTGETGSLRYMAPEVMSNEPYNHLVDMYSMGVILFELMVSKDERPFTKLTRENIKEKVVGEEYRPSVRDLPPAIADVVTRCWAQDPDARPESYDVIQGLCKILIQYMDAKWRIRGTDSWYNWMTDFVFKEYMKTLDDFDLLCWRIPEKVVIETTAKRYINCANKLEKMKDLRCKMVRERMHNLLQRYQMSLVEMPRETKEKDTEGGSEYISLQELQEKEPPVPENWPPTFQAQNNECRIA